MVRGWGVPPAADTVWSALDPSGDTTMLSSGPQEAPRLASTSHRVIGVPPVIGTFLISLRVTYPTHWPSGEKKGW